MFIYAFIKLINNYVSICVDICVEESILILVVVNLKGEIMSNYVISSNDIIDRACTNDGKVCEKCGCDATGGNNKIQFCYDKVLCEPCGETFMEEKKQDLLKMIKEGGLD